MHSYSFSAREESDVTSADIRGKQQIRKGLHAFALIVALLGPGVVYSQSTTGVTGLLLVPTARMQPDGSVGITYGHVDRRYSEYMDGQYGYSALSGSVTFLPFVEVAFRFSNVDSPEPQALGDRMLMVRLQLMNEKGYRPAVLVGAHDFLKSSANETSNFHSMYAVVSKRIRVLPFSIDAHLGYGTAAFEAKHTQFQGVFGGVSFPVVRMGELLFEYDARVTTVGARVHLFDHIYVQGGFQQLNAPIWSVTAHTRL